MTKVHWSEKATSPASKVLRELGYTKHFINLETDKEGYIPLRTLEGELPWHYLSGITTLDYRADNELSPIAEVTFEAKVAGLTFTWEIEIGRYKDVRRGDSYCLLMANIVNILWCIVNYTFYEIREQHLKGMYQLLEANEKALKEVYSRQAERLSALETACKQASRAIEEYPKGGFDFKRLIP